MQYYEVNTVINKTESVIYDHNDMVLRILSLVFYHSEPNSPNFKFPPSMAFL